MKSRFDRHEKKLNEFMGMRATEQRSANLEQDVRQPRLAMEADVAADKKTRERTKGAATAGQAMHGDDFSTNRVQAGPTCSTSYGVKAEPPVLSCRDGILVEHGAAAPKSWLSPLEMHTLTAAGGLLPTGKISTATRTTLHQLPLSFVLPDRRDKFEDFNSVRLVLQHFGWINNQQAPFWPRVIEIKSRQNLVFDPGGSTVRLLVCPFLGTWRELLCGEVFTSGRWMRLQCFLAKG